MNDNILKFPMEEEGKKLKYHSLEMIEGFMQSYKYMHHCLVDPEHPLRAHEYETLLQDIVNILTDRLNAHKEGL